MFSALFVSCTSLFLSPSLWRSCCFAFNKQNCPVFEPIPVFSLCSCQCRTDICRGALFRPLRFFYKVRYVNWPTLPLRNTCMCCMWAANQSLCTASHPRLILLLSFRFTNLFRCWGQKRFYRNLSLICSSVMRVYHKLALWEIPSVIWICCRR